MDRRQVINMMGMLPVFTFLPGICSRFKEDNHHRPFLIEAHRGNSIDAPENTMEAIEQAIMLGVDRVEIDLEFSKDGKAVIIHDNTVDRTTNATGKVAEMTWDELKKLDAGNWKSERYRNARIPLLTDVLDLCKGRTMVNIDLKNEKAIFEMVHIIKQMKMEGQVVITGLIPECTDIIRSAAVYLTMFYESTSAFRRLFQQKKYFECIEIAVVEARSSCLPGFLFQSDWITCEIVHLAHLHGLAVNVYEVNTPNMVRRMLKSGVDAIMTNDPLMVMRTWDEIKHHTL